MLVSNACIQISKFTSLPIWTSSWIPTLPSFGPAPRYPSHHVLPSLLISDLFHPDSLQWRSPLINSLFEEESAKAILELKISANHRASYIWTPSTSGRFTTNSAYLAIIHNSLPDLSCHQSSVWKELWKLKLNDRLKLSLWKIAWNILPTDDRLKFFQPVYCLKLCLLCQAAEDSLHHLFFKCDIARVVWRNSPWPLDSTVFNFPSMMD